MVATTACEPSASATYTYTLLFKSTVVQVVSTVTTGEYFGQQALWKTNTPRAATAVTKTPCVFYTLERTQFQNLLGPLDQIWRFQALQKVCVLPCIFPEL